jgi:hypothetical protein
VTLVTQGSKNGTEFFLKMGISKNGEMSHIIRPRNTGEKISS